MIKLTNLEEQLSEEIEGQLEDFLTKEFFKQSEEDLGDKIWNQFRVQLCNTFGFQLHRILSND